MHTCGLCCESRSLFSPLELKRHQISYIVTILIMISVRFFFVDKLLPTTVIIGHDSNRQWLSFTALGLATTYFLHCNPLRGDHAVLLFAFLTLASAAFAYTLLLLPVYESIRFSLLGIAHIFGTIITTTIIYRLSPLHPLWGFPGPLVNKITSLKIAQIVYSGRRHIIVPDLHKKYGTFVRTGPNTLSINSHTAIAPIYASSTAFPKSNAYTPGHMHGDGLFFLQGHEEHNARRKIWARAFLPNVVSGWHPIIEKRVLELLSCMDTRSGHGIKVLDFSDAILHWSYDVMADLTYGGASPLNMMAKGDPNEYIEGGKLSTILFEVLGEVPSLFDLLWYLPMTGIARHMEKFAQSLIDARRMGNAGRPDDIASWLLGEHDNKPTNLSSDTLRIESLFAIQAGSDTTSGVLTFAFYHLLTHKHALERLVQELDEEFADYDKSTIPQKKLANLPYLNAVVDESLRLGTPFPGLPRVVPTEGAMISDRFIPGSTIVAVNPWAQMTSEENFYPDPNVFRPERWLPGGVGPESRVRRNAMLSFSFGSFSCLGKSLAIQEMRLVLAHVLLKYNLEFAPEWDRKKFEDGIHNMRTTVFNYPLLVTLTSRY